MSAKLHMQKISSIRVQELHKVKLLMPALCRVRQGKKIIEWRGHTEIADPSRMILIPAGYELYIENRPADGHFLSEIISIPSPLISFYLQHYHAPPEEYGVHKFCISLTAELDYCWEQLKYALDRELAAELPEHMMLGLLLMLRKTSAASILLNIPGDAVSTRCQALIMLSPSSRWTARDIANQLHMSVSTLNRHLAAEGGSFRQILDDVRLGNALNALQTTSLPISEIASDNGYQCSSRFTSRFKKRFQVTPRALRQAVNGKVID